MTKLTTLSAACIIALAACGESTSDTRPTAPVSHSVATLDAPAPDPLSSVVDEPAPADLAVAESDPPEPENTMGSEPAPEQAAAPQDDPLSIKRLVVAHDVREREPVGAQSPFAVTDGEPVYAFVEMVNEDTAPRRISITFESAQGRSVGPVTLEIPARVPRWRTWARSGWIRTPGSWTVSVRDEGGALIDQTSFEVEG